MRKYHLKMLFLLIALFACSEVYALNFENCNNKIKINYLGMTTAYRKAGGQDVFCANFGKADPYLKNCENFDITAKSSDINESIKAQISYILDASYDNEKYFFAADSFSTKCGTACVKWDGIDNGIRYYYGPYTNSHANYFIKQIAIWYFTDFTIFKDGNYNQVRKEELKVIYGNEFSGHQMIRKKIQGLIEDAKAAKINNQNSILDIQTANNEMKINDDNTYVATITINAKNLIDDNVKISCENRNVEIDGQKGEKIYTLNGKKEITIKIKATDVNPPLKINLNVTGKSKGANEYKYSFDGGYDYNFYQKLFLSNNKTNQISDSITLNIPKPPETCEVDKPDNLKFSCNKGHTFNSTCEKFNFMGKNIKITQTGNMSSVLNPGTIYQGGGFNFGILYSNKVIFECTGCSGTDILKKAMDNRIKSLANFSSGLKLENMTFNGIPYDKSFLYNQCKEEYNIKNTDNYRALTTTCLFHLPEVSISKYSGVVKYNGGQIGNGINNKYYIPLNYAGNYYITIDNITGLSRLDEKKAKGDTIGGKSAWFGTWTGRLENCSLHVKSLFYDKNNVYNFIYRPIDLNNPFPDRNAGINWFEWIKNDSNKQRLKDSYTELQYSIELDNQKVSQIREYNSNNNYLDWSNIKNGESSFITKFFQKSRVSSGGNS